MCHNHSSSKEASRQAGMGMEVATPTDPATVHGASATQKKGKIYDTIVVVVYQKDSPQEYIDSLSDEPARNRHSLPLRYKSHRRQGVRGGARHVLVHRIIEGVRQTRPSRRALVVFRNI